MRLLFCGDCGDVFRLQKALKNCSCGGSYGAIAHDDISACLSSDTGNVIPLSIDTSDLKRLAEEFQKTGEEQSIVMRISWECTKREKMPFTSAQNEASP